MTTTDLFHTDDPAAWTAALARYEQVIEAMDVPRLVELDRFFREELPARIAARAPAHVTLDELAAATEWKMKRGTWRARNLLLVTGNPEQAVREASEAAFALVPDPRKPVARLAELDGVGPATASAILAAHRPDLYPFFDEIVAAEVTDPPLGPVAFTLPYYLRYAARLRERAASLGPGFTPQMVSQALFAAAARSR